jgi:SOS-response transcriptional repressor LexA
VALDRRGSTHPAASPQASDNTLSRPAQEALARLAALPGAAADSPAVRAAVRAIIAGMERAFPAGRTWKPSNDPVRPGAIPIVGRTAAGAAAAWEQFFAGKEEPEVLERLIRGVETRAATRRGAQVAAVDAAGEPSQPRDPAALIIQLSQPTADGVAEYVDLPGLPDVGPGAFALRVDGDSMAPRIRDGDIIVCRRDARPLPGQTAVVKVRGRIGVTVKLWRPEGDRVHLIPINEAHPQSVLPLKDVLWACRVLWVVRL